MSYTTRHLSYIVEPRGSSHICKLLFLYWTPHTHIYFHAPVSHFVFNGTPKLARVIYYYGRATPIPNLLYERGAHINICARTASVHVVQSYYVRSYLLKDTSTYGIFARSYGYYLPTRSRILFIIYYIICTVLLYYITLILYIYRVYYILDYRQLIMHY